MFRGWQGETTQRARTSAARRDFAGEASDCPDAKQRRRPAIARDGTRDGSDAFFDDAKKGLAAKPDNTRLHALYADLHNARSSIASDWRAIDALSNQPRRFQ